MMDEYLKTIHNLQPDTAATLYHYCATEKLHYLLAPGADLNCRYLSCQSDKEEYRFGLKIVCDYIRAKGVKYRELGDRLEDNLVSNIGCVGQRCVGPLIPLSFSMTEKVNSKYHYEEYCKKEGGGAIAFSQSKLDSMMGAQIERGVAIRLIKCYYEGQDQQAIDAICEAIWIDQKENFSRLIRSEYLDSRVANASLCEICTAASHFKCKRFCGDDEWRIVMVCRARTCNDSDGFCASGIRDKTCNKDLIEVMEGVVVYSEINCAGTLREFSRFGLQQRKRDFKVWV